MVFVGGVVTWCGAFYGLGCVGVPERPLQSWVLFDYVNYSILFDLEQQGEISVWRTINNFC